MAEEKKEVCRSCNFQKKCGGCQLQNLSYRRQLQHKQVQIIKLLGKYHHVNEIIGMEHPTHYRHKVQAAFAMRGGHLVSGIYQSSTGTVLPVDSCMIQNPAADGLRLISKSYRKNVRFWG